jgi:preprotein translocase subunit SecY
LGILSDVLRVPEARRRAVHVLVILCVFRAGFHVPVPGAAPIDLVHGMGAHDRVPNWLAAATQFSAGNANYPTLFALGVLPYLAAALLFSLLALVIPSWRALLRNGEEGRRVARRYLRYLTVPMCMFLGSMIVAAWSSGRGGSDSLPFPEWRAMFQVLTLCAGSLLLLWLCERLSDLGIGDGIAFLAAAGLLAHGPTVLAIMVRMVTDSDPDYSLLYTRESAIVLGLSIAVVAVVVLMGRISRRVPVQGRDGPRIGEHYMPLGLRASGSLPLLVAQTLLLPAAAILSRPLGVLAYYIESCFFLFCLSRFWTRFMLQPMELANNLRSQGARIPGIDPGPATARHLERIMKRVAWTEAAFLALLILVPPLLLHAMGSQPLFQLWLMSMVIIAWGALDFIEAMERIPAVRPDEPPHQGQPSRLQPAPRAPSLRAQARPDAGYEGG